MRKINLAMAAVLLLASPQPILAEDKPKPQPMESYVSGLLGAGITTSSGGGTSLAFSGRIGTGLYSDPSGVVSLGLVVGDIMRSTSVGTTTIDGSTLTIMPELIGRNLFGTGFYLGARLGIGLLSANIKAQSGASYSGSATAFLVGPAAGYEIPITPVPGLALDLDASWLTAGSSTMTFPTLGTVSLDSSSALLLQAGVTYHW